MGGFHHDDISKGENRMANSIRSIAIWLTVICGVVSPELGATGWPTEGGNNQRTFSTDSPLTMPLTLKWTCQAPAVPKLAWSSAEGRTIEEKLMGSRIRFDDAFR